MTQTGATNGAKEHAPDAVVYVPGLQLGLRDQRTFDGVTQRIALACDRQSESRAVRWRVESQPADLEGYDDLQKRTVFARNGDVAQPVVDVYEFAWAREMTSRWERQGTRTKLARGAIGFWYGAKLFALLMVAALRERSARRLFQALIALLALGVVLAYVATLIGAALTVVLQWTGSIGDDDWRGLQQWTIVFTAGVTAVVPALRDRVPQVGASLLATSDYVRLPPEAQRIGGELTSFIEAIEESGRHQRVHVVAYSMGSIVAFDTLFPATAEPPRSLDGVRTLVTIGPPFATVRATRGTYFDGRKPGKPPTRWVTYWAAADLLSSARPLSRKREQLEFGGGRPTVKSYDLPVDLRFFNMLAFYGFSTHGMYWGADGEQDRNVFDLVVGDLGLPGGAGAEADADEPEDEPVDEPRDETADEPAPPEGTPR